MARCGSTTDCACAVQPGDGITVTGDGTPGTPYVIALDTVTAATVTVGDSDTVDLAITGSGSSADPYVITASVIGSTVTPAVNPTLDLVGDAVGDGLGYDAGTRIVSARLSADAGNGVRYGSDGGLFAPGEWVQATVDSIGPLLVTVDGAAGQPAVAMPAYTPSPTDVVYAIPGPAGYLLLGTTT